MIQIIADNGCFEIKVKNGETLELFVNGQSKGEIRALPAYVQKGHVAIFGCSTSSTKAVVCITTGIIREIK